MPPRVSSDPDHSAESERLAAHGVVRLRAENPGPLTLSGTNTWIVGASPAWVVDPGPDLEGHLEALIALVDARGGLGGIALTHDHSDHGEAVESLRARRPAPLAGARGEVDVRLEDGVRFGGLLAVGTPGHAPDHVALVSGRACFTGDAVLGEGSVFVDSYPGALAGYMAGLERLAALDLDVLCPGHGPAIWEPARKVAEYLEHRRERERRLLETLAAGGRTVAELLDGAWSDVPATLRPAAALTLAAHLEKLEEEGRLPEGVER
jgi:glyoxylase-like metal-dependent hydrolase (beta-lactamase superfamily II)